MSKREQSLQKPWPQIGQNDPPFTSLFEHLEQEEMDTLVDAAREWERGGERGGEREEERECEGDWGDSSKNSLSSSLTRDDDRESRSILNWASIVEARYARRISIYLCDVPAIVARSIAFSSLPPIRRTKNGFAPDRIARVSNSSLFLWTAIKNSEFPDRSWKSGSAPKRSNISTIVKQLAVAAHKRQVSPSLSGIFGLAPILS